MNFPVILATSDSGSILSLLLDADIIVQSVLLILAAMSIICWVIIFKKIRRISAAQRSTKVFLDAFWNKDQKMENIFAALEEYNGSPVAQVFSKVQHSYRL